MAQTLSINETQTIISDRLDDVWEAETPKKAPTYTEYCNVINMDRGEYVDYRVAGLGKFVERDELEDIDYDDLSFGEKQTTKPKNFARGFRVSEEVIEDLADSGFADTEARAKLGTYEDIVKRWRRSAEWTVDVQMADRLLNGTSTATGYVLRDNVAYFGTHTTLKNPTISQSNLNTHASLSAIQLQTMTTALDLQLDDRGDYIGDDGVNILVVSASDDYRAYEILNTSGQVDTMNNNVNPLRKDRYRIVVNKYLNVNAASFAGYYLLRDGVHSLSWLWRKKPVFGKDGDFDAVAMKYRARFRGASMIRDWRGSVGDAGS